MLPICVAVDAELQSPHSMHPLLYSTHVLGVRETVVSELRRRPPLVGRPSEVLVQIVTPKLWDDATVAEVLPHIVDGVRGVLGPEHRYLIGQRTGPRAIEIICRPIEDEDGELSRLRELVRILSRDGASKDGEIARLRSELAHLDAFGGDAS